MTFDVAAFKIQNMFLVRKAHNHVVDLIISQYNKIYDRATGHFYYYYDGIANPTPENPKHREKSYLAVDVQWKKPLNLRSRDCKTVFTEDLAALRIQFAFRAAKAKEFMRALVRKFFQYCYDPITGRHYYRNTVNGHSMWRKPFSLGRERWDPGDVREWDVDEVVYFFRKMGFKKHGYCDAVKDLAVDGLLLLTFEWEDYNNLGINRSMHIKLILLQLHRRPWFHSHIDDTKDIERRDRLRRHHNIEAAAKILQRKYRARHGRAKFRALQEVIRLEKAKAEREAAVKEGQNWWPQVSKESKKARKFLFVAPPVSASHFLSPFPSPHFLCVSFLTNNIFLLFLLTLFLALLLFCLSPQHVRDFSGLNPAIKVQHGKRRIFQSVHGWGHYVNQEFIPAHPELNDEHISKMYSDKLLRNGPGFTGGDITDALNKIDVSTDHIMGGGKKAASSKRFN